MKINTTSQIKQCAVQSSPIIIYILHSRPISILPPPVDYLLVLTLDDYRVFNKHYA